MAAAKKGRREVCELLLKRGADPAATDAQGMYLNLVDPVFADLYY